MIVFISHRFEDKAQFENVTDEFDREGIQYWQPQSIQAGGLLADQLRNAIASCKLCVFIATAQSVKSTWCNAELGAFWGAGKDVLIYKSDSTLKDANLAKQFRGHFLESRLKGLTAAVKARLQGTGESREKTSLLTARDLYESVDPSPTTIVELIAAVEGKLREARSTVAGAETLSQHDPGVFEAAYSENIKHLEQSLRHLRAAQEAVRQGVSNLLVNKEPEEAQEYLDLAQAMPRDLFQENFPALVHTLLRQTELDEASTDLTPEDIADRIVRLVEPDSSKLRMFVKTLAAGWSVRKSSGLTKREFPLFLLMTFLRTHHPKVYQLLAYDPRSAMDLHLVLTEGTTPSPSPIYLFFRQTFRHAFKVAFPVYFESTRKDQDEVVNELIARLDRHKGDRAFQELWRQEFRDREETDIIPLVTAVLRSDQSNPKV